MIDFVGEKFALWSRWLYIGTVGGAEVDHRGRLEGSKLGLGYILEIFSQLRGSRAAATVACNIHSTRGCGRSQWCNLGVRSTSRSSPPVVAAHGGRAVYTGRRPYRPSGPSGRLLRSVGCIRGVRSVDRPPVEPAEASAAGPVGRLGRAHEVRSRFIFLLSVWSRSRAPHRMHRKKQRNVPRCCLCVA